MLLFLRGVYLVTEIQLLLPNNGIFPRIRKSSHVRYVECRIVEWWNRIRCSETRPAMVRDGYLERRVQIPLNDSRYHVRLRFLSEDLVNLNWLKFDFISLKKKFLVKVAIDRDYRECNDLSWIIKWFMMLKFLFEHLIRLNRLKFEFILRKEIFYEIIAIDRYSRKSNDLSFPCFDTKLIFAKIRALRSWNSISILLFSFFN